MSSKVPRSAKDYLVTEAFLNCRVGDGRYGRSKWIQYCDHMLKIGRQVYLTETVGTYSKYLTVYGQFDLKFKVRFSDHLPNYRRQSNGDCDFFVGVTHFGTWTVNDAIKATEDYFNVGKCDREAVCEIRQEQGGQSKEEDIW